MCISVTTNLLGLQNYGVKVVLTALFPLLFQEQSKILIALLMYYRIRKLIIIELDLHGLELIRHKKSCNKA